MRRLWFRSFNFHLLSWIIVKCAALQKHTTVTHKSHTHPPIYTLKVGSTWLHLIFQIQLWMWQIKECDALLCPYQRFKPPVQNTACKYLMLLQLILVLLQSSVLCVRFSCDAAARALHTKSYKLQKDKYKEMAYELEIIPCAVKAHVSSSAQIVFLCGIRSKCSWTAVWHVLSTHVWINKCNANTSWMHADTLGWTERKIDR